MSYVYEPMSESEIKEIPQTEGTIMYHGDQKVFVPPPPKYRSMFERFFYIDDGVISISLKDMTVIGTLGITASLLAMLY